jgi:hypothetical protein
MARRRNYVPFDPDFDPDADGAAGASGAPDPEYSRTNGYGSSSSQSGTPSSHFSHVPESKDSEGDSGIYGERTGEKGEEVRTTSKEEKSGCTGTAVPAAMRDGVRQALLEWDVLTLSQVKRYELAERLLSEGCEPRDIDVLGEYCSKRDASQVGAALCSILQMPKVWRSVMSDIRLVENAKKMREEASSKPEPGERERRENMELIQKEANYRYTRRCGMAYCMLVAEHKKASQIALELGCTEAEVWTYAREGAQYYGEEPGYVDEVLKKKTRVEWREWFAKRKVVWQERDLASKEMPPPMTKGQAIGRDMDRLEKWKQREAR